MQKNPSQTNCHMVELLAPAGNMEAFRGALHAGADAIYLGGRDYGARAYAENFSEEEIIETLKEAHLFGVRVYLTANVLTRETELPGLVLFVSHLYESGLDGVIVQDLGAAAAIHAACPDLPLHASTQMSVMGADAARFLKRLGFNRVVPARELSLQEIRLLKETGIEVETFIHGAMCYSCSGRCLMSSFLGGRSGNRGRCAGTCRLPYEIVDEERQQIALSKTARRGREKERLSGNRPSVRSENRDLDKEKSALFGRSFACLQSPENQGRDVGKPTEVRLSASMHKSARNANAQGRVSAIEEYPLSMKDLCALPILPELMDAGIDSFKIEGRMKKPEYAAGVTAIYRRYIDRFYDWDAAGRPGTWEIDPADMDGLLSLYIRTDLSTGYYHERNGRDMVTIGKPGYRGASPELLARIRKEYIESDRMIPVAGKARIMASEPMSLEVCLARPEGTGALTSWNSSGSSENGPGTLGTGNNSVSLENGRETLKNSLESPENGPDSLQNGSFISYTAVDDPVQAALRRPLTEEDIREKLGRTGGTFFAFEKLDVETDGASFVPVAALNDLRRRALDGLEDEILRQYSKDARKYSQIPGAGDVNMQVKRREFPQTKGPNRLMVSVQSQEQMDAVLREGPLIQAVILDGVLRKNPAPVLDVIRSTMAMKRPRLYATLPQILRESDDEWLEAYVARYGRCLDGFVVRNLEELEFLHRIGYEGEIIADSPLYCWNRKALSALKPYCDRNVLPLELDRREMTRTFAEDLPRMILTVYGRAPMMISANCVRKTAGRCMKETGRPESPYYYLKDRTGAFLPVQIDCMHCYNVIYNSVPTSLISCLRDPVDALVQSVGGLLFVFTDESGQETARILREVYDQKSVKNSAAEGSTHYTYGHYRKGAD